MSSRQLVIACAFAVVTLAACGGSEAAGRSYVPCKESCSGLCVPFCPDGSCSDQVCAPNCSDSTTCLSGHACAEYTNGKACSPVCDSALCPTETECSGLHGECAHFECGERTACADPATFCALTAHRCYPLSGACTVVDDCPPLDAAQVAIQQVACSAHYCRLSMRPPSPIPGLETTPPLPLQTPRPGDAFANQADVVLSWSGPDLTVLALVLDSPVQSTSEVLAHAVWGMARRPGLPPTAHLADGVLISGGRWTQASGLLPVGKPLYALVQLVRPGEAVQLSPLVPFMIGGQFPASGDACASNGVVPACGSPSAPLGCRGSSCQIMCASHVDCAAFGLACGAPDSGYRYCE